MTEVLEVAGLGFAYPDGHRALVDVSMSIGAGERVALLGPNGAGKTTLSLQLNGIHRAQSGSVRVDGMTLDDDSVAEIRRRVGLVFQDPNDQLFMPTVGEDVAFGPANLGLRGEALQDRVEQALSTVGAESLLGRAPHHLSGGERRRVAIATVLAMQPDVLVLDEPSSGLDPSGRRELIEVLASLPMAQLVITHDLPLALELCPRAMIMNNGTIVADDSTRALFANDDLLAENRLELPFGIDGSLFADTP